jgi:CheY-like chemotaxis protein
MIRDNVRLEARLIEDLLDLSRIARGNLEYRFETVDVHPLIGRVVEICQDQIAAKKHQVGSELAAVEHHVRGDPARLQQVLWNLLINAVKYTPEGGRIAIRTLCPCPGRLAIEVTDNGIGIQPDLLPHLFDAFERGSGAAASHASGLGLGLTISRSIVEAHGGTLQGASDGRDRGATFRLELATVTAPGDSGELSTGPPSPTGRGLRVLLAEDDAATVETAAAVLRRQGHVVTTATSLSQALAVSPDDFDVVVSDLDLGDGSGLELMRQFRSRGDTPGIALSGYATEDDVRQSREAGFAVHLAKPITFEMLVSAIHQVTAGRSC